MTLVVDASVALKWVLSEDGSERALQLVEQQQLYASDFLILECANVLATQVRRNVMTVTQASEALEIITDAPVRFFPYLELVRVAQSLSVRLGRSAYDCLYSALALNLDFRLITADIKFARAVMTHRDYENLIEVF